MNRNDLTTLRCLLLAASIGGLWATSLPASQPGVHGRVLETDNRGRMVGPVSDARVEFLDESGSVTASASSGSNGYYKASLIPGRYTYRVTATGFRDEDSARGIEHAMADGYSVQTFTLVRGENENRKKTKPTLVPVGILYGKVRFRTTSGELKPVKTAQIQLRRIGQSDLRQYPSSSRPSAGSYGCTLPAGRWQIVVDAPGFERLTITQPIEVVSGTKTRQDFLLKPMAPESPKNQGIRTIAVLRGKHKPNSEQVMLVIDAEKAPPPHRRTRTVTSGSHFRQDLPSGLYRLAAVAKGYRPAFSHSVLVNESGYANVRLDLWPAERPQEPTPTFEAPEKADAELAITVKLANATTREIRPLSGVDVRLQRMKQNDIETPAAPAVKRSSNRQGMARFENIEPGKYHVLASHGQHAAREIMVDVKGGPNRASILLRSERRIVPDLPPPTERDAEPERREEHEPPRKPAYGYVVYRDDSGTARGVSGASLVIESNPSGAVVSGNLGRFEVALPDGYYRITPRPSERFEGATQRIEIRNRALMDYVYLKRIARTVATVPSRRPNPTPAVTGLWLTVYDANDPAKSLTQTRVSIAGPAAARTADYSPELKLYQASLPPGVYQVRLSHPGYQPVTVRVAVSRDRLTEKSVGLQRMRFDNPSPTVSGALLTARVFGVGGQYHKRPLSGVHVTLSQLGHSKFSGNTGHDGSVVAKVPAGLYQIDIRRPGLSPVSKIVSVVGSTAKTFYMQSTTTATPNSPPIKWSFGRSAAGAFPPHGQGGGAVLSVRVQSSGGEFGTLSLPGARVKITQLGRVFYNGMTSGSGTTTAKLPAAGLYQVDVQRSGYKPASQIVAVGASSSVTITMLAANQISAIPNFGRSRGQLFPITPWSTAKPGGPR
jgi:hypothetical protein